MKKADLRLAQRLARMSGPDETRIMAAIVLSRRRRARVFARVRFARTEAAQRVIRRKAEVMP